jgi:hypothetical protein
MPKLRSALLPLLLSLSTLLLAGCSILSTGTETPPLSAAAVATAIGHVRPSKADTCETRVQVAEQSSKIATLQTGKETVYKAGCDPRADGSAAVAQGAPAAKKPAVPAKPDVKPARTTGWERVLPPELEPEVEWHRQRPQTASAG